MERPEKNRSSLEKNVEAAFSRYEKLKEQFNDWGFQGKNIFLMQVASALEDDEIQLFVSTADLFMEKTREIEPAIDNPEYLYLDSVNHACLAGALEIVKKNRVDSSKEADQSSKVARVRKVVKKNLE